MLIQDLGLLSGKLVILSHLDDERILVGVVVQINEAIVEQESRVTLLSVRVVDLLAALDVFEGLNDETLALVCVRPAGLPRALVVEHVGVRDEAISLDSFNLDSKDSTGHHHSYL